MGPGGPRERAVGEGETGAGLGRPRREVRRGNHLQQQLGKGWKQCLAQREHF